MYERMRNTCKETYDKVRKRDMDGDLLDHTMVRDYHISRMNVRAAD